MELPLTFVLFFKGENKIRKKNIKCDSWKKRQVKTKLSLKLGYLLGRYGEEP